MDLDDWTPHVGSACRIRPSGGEPLAAELIAADPLGPEQGGRRSAYSLLFRAPAEPLLAQGIRRVEHPELGALDLFLVPIGPGAEGGMVYEAVFNRDSGSGRRAR